MSSYAFLDRTLDRLSPGGELGAEVVALADKARATYNMLAALQNKISQIKGTVDNPSAPS